jgi:hypothetical protein
LRRFVCRPGGKYAGEHKVYDSIEEFKKHQPQSKLYRWNTQEFMNIETGDWLEAEDGFIVQLLSRRVMMSKDSVTKRDIFRFPQGTFAVHQLKSGIYKFAVFYAQFTNGDKSSISGKQYTAREADFPKIRFAAMVCAGMSPHMAFRNVFQPGKRFLTRQQIEKKILRLFMDPVVRKEIESNMLAFKDKIKHDIKLEDVINKIKSHWQSVKPGSAQEMSAIEFMMEIHEVLVIDETSKRRKVINKMDDAEEAEILAEGIPAPLLGEGED